MPELFPPYFVAFPCNTQALGAGRPVYLTDGTVTRSVTAVEIDGYGLRKFPAVSTRPSARITIGDPSQMI